MVYLGPKCPSCTSFAKSICIRVTSGGNIAAPGPSLMSSNYEMHQLRALVLYVKWWSDIPSTVTLAGGSCSRLNRENTYSSQPSHPLYYADHLEYMLDYCRRSRGLVVFSGGTNYLSFDAKIYPCQYLFKILGVARQLRDQSNTMRKCRKVRDLL